MARNARLELEVDGRGARRGASEAERELARLKRQARETTEELRGLGQGADRTGRSADRAGREIDGMRRSTDRASNSFLQGRVSASGFAGSLRTLGVVAAGVVAIQLGRKFLEYADSAKQMDASLRLAISSTTSFASAQADVRRIAAETRGGLEETTELYSKVSRISQEMGKSQDDAARFTETFAKTLKISGASANEASAATRQFGQALASGVLRGDEFNSIMEASPRLSKLLADSLGVPTGALRKMAEEGELTADKLYTALTDTKFTAAIDEEFKLIPITFDEAMTRVNDAATVTFGAFDRGGRFSEALVNFMLGGVENLDTLEDRAEQFGIDVRAAIEGLGDAFEPFYNAGVAVFEALGIDARSLRDEIASVLAMGDDIANGLNAGLGGFEKWIDRNLWGVGDSPSNMAGRFTRRFDQAQQRGETERTERDFRNALPRGFDFRRGGDATDFVNRTGIYAPRTAPAARPTSADPSGRRRGGGGKSEAEREAERLEKLAETRAQREKEFFAQLRDSVAMASRLPEQAALLNEELKLRAILNDGQKSGEREITDEQKKQIAALVAQRNAASLLRDMREATADALGEQLRLEDRARVSAASTLETEEDNLELQERLWPYKLEAMRKGIDLQDETLKKTLAELEARERTNIALERKERLIREGVAVAEQYRTPGQVRDDDLAQLGRDRTSLEAARAAGKVRDDVYAAAVKGLNQAVFETAHRFDYEFTEAIVSLASEFDGQLGAVLGKVAKVFDVIASQSRGDFSKSGPIGAIIGLFNGPNGNPVADAATKASQQTLKEVFSGSAFKNPLGSLSKGFGDFKGDLKNLFGKGGDFAKGLGSVLGKAGMGAQMGSAADGIMKALGIKSSKTGAQIGGAIGNAVGGPIGGLIGSIGGGLIGGLFKKTPTGSVSINESGFSTRGKLGGELSGAGGAVGSQLKQIADTLGADLGAFSVAIGKRKDEFRVSASGSAANTTKKKTGADIIYKGKDEEAAVRAAIANAIADGALKGLSPTIERIVRNAGSDFEKGITDALKVKSVFDAYREMTDPIGFALEELNKGFQSVVDIMRTAGATADEFSQAEKVYQKQRADIIEQGNNNSLKEMREYLFALRGGTSSVLSPELRLKTAKDELDRLDALRAGGGAVDFGKYQSTADAFLAASRDAKGSTLGFFADLERVTSTVQSMIDAVKAPSINTPSIDFSPVVSTLDSQTAILADLLGQIRDGMGYGGSSGGSEAIVRVTMSEPRYMDLL